MPFDPESLFETFLIALNEAEAGERLHKMHAPDALVRSPTGLQRAEEVAPSEFARSHRSINLEFPGKLPQFAQPALVKALPVESDGTWVCWFEVVESRQQQRLSAAVGFR